jgi:predicted transcriptional regulator
LENVNELADYGLLKLEEDGQAKRPVVWYDEIDVDLPLTSTGAQRDPANA